MSKAGLALALCAALLGLAAGCARATGGAGGVSYEEGLERWKAERLAGLKGDEGWLTLIGLHWLKEGENRLGSDPSNDIKLPAGKAPAFAGTLRLAGGAVRLEAAPGSGITEGGRPVTALDLKSDADGSPTKLELGPLAFHLISRGGQFGLRVRDRESPARVDFKGLEYFPADRRWVVAARLEPYDPPRPVIITNVLGMETEEVSPGAVAFEVDGRTYKLDAIRERGVEKLFIIFADATSGAETYGAGRYLYADPPDAAGRLTLDFNKAYSPPCAFTAFATCPLPPFQNRLPLRIEAGEKYSDAGH